jgi:Domain of unknown function (DUF1918)
MSAPRVTVFGPHPLLTVTVERLGGPRRGAANPTHRDRVERRRHRLRSCPHPSPVSYRMRRRTPAGSVALMPAKITPGRIGDSIEVSSHGGAPARHGEIVEVIGEAHHERVRWDDGHESIHYPSDGTRITPAAS